MNHLNQVYSSPSTQRRYEAWFVRLGLADGSGAWWFRYLLLNPGRDGCSAYPIGMPVQVWATWFPAGRTPQSFIQGFALRELHLSPRRQNPLHFSVGNNEITDDACRGRLHADGHDISWDLHYSSSFGITLSDKGWIGFSRTPHSDAAFFGHILFDGRKFEGHPLGFGLQGHNCGYRHRGFWTWAHAFFPQSNGQASTLEALVYDMPLGITFRKVVLWHRSKRYTFGKMKESVNDRTNLQWNFVATSKNGSRLEASIDGRGSSLHRLPYLRTDCSGSFEVCNNSLANATVRYEQPGKSPETLETTGGAVLEVGGQG